MQWAYLSGIRVSSPMYELHWKHTLTSMFRTTSNPSTITSRHKSETQMEVRSGFTKFM